MKISIAQSKTEVRNFIDLPYKLYRHDPLWVPPLRNQIKAQFDPNRNPLLQHCEFALFSLFDHGQVVGRIAAFIDHLALEAWGELIGLFGYYESPPNMEAATLILNTARDWLKRHGMQAMRGPWSFVSQEWGAVVEGFEPPPVGMAPYNPPYYNEQFESFGLRKAKDLLVYYIDAREGYHIPERMILYTDRIAARFNVGVRQLDMGHFENDIETLIQLSNASLVNNWGYAPVTEAEVRAMAQDLKPILQPKAVVFAEDAKGKAIGFAIAIPDINILLKKLNGRLLPFGWAQLLWKLPRLTQYRMFALGVVPEYHGKGIDGLIYRHLYENCYRDQLRVEINYVLEDNASMNNAILKLGAKPLRRYRVYQVGI